MNTKSRAFRFTDDDIAMIKWLSNAWGPVQPMDQIAVLRESLRRAKHAEERKKPKKGKNVEAETI